MGLSEVLTDVNVSGAVIKAVSADRSKLKIKPAAIKLVTNKRTGEITATRLTFFSSKAALSRLTAEEQIEVTFVPNAKAEALGFVESSATITLVPGSAKNVQIKMSFAGDPLLPQNSSSPLLARRIGRLVGVTTEEPLEITQPANAASFAFGFGGEPQSLTSGPGDTDMRYGSGTTDDPLYVVFNNPNSGLETELVDVSAVPEDLLSADGVPGFTQMYAGANASSDVLVTLTGTLALDPETQALNLTLEDGTVISYSDDAPDEATELEDLSALAGSAGLDLNSTLDFYDGETLELTIPSADIQRNILAGLNSSDEVSNPSVTITSPVTGTLTMSANELTGSFSTSGVISFDVPGFPGATQIISGTNNIQLSFSSDKPAILSGFTLENAKGSVQITGGTGVVRSISAEFVINSAVVSIDGGISASDVTITSISPELAF